MNTIVIEPGGLAPKLVDIEADWREFSKIVGGYIEGVDFPVAGTVAYINEEGKLHDLPPNLLATAAVSGRLRSDDYIAGPMIVVGVRGSEEVGLTEEQAVEVIELLSSIVADLP